jgi:cell fate (sporulation/competence/biofilm development) regulator YlbF (YheA/YmcA/DUF963 family)
MSSPLNSVSPTTKIDPFEAAHILGNLLSQTPEYKAFLAALKAVNSDPDSQKLSAEMRGHQAALQSSRDIYGEHAAELTRLELELGDLPAMKEYHSAEREIRALFHSVDEIISKESDVAFAVSAQRGGCACGG